MRAGVTYPESGVVDLRANPGVKFTDGVLSASKFWPTLNDLHWLIPLEKAELATWFFYSLYSLNTRISALAKIVGN